MKSTDTTRRKRFRRMLCGICAACIVAMNMNVGLSAAAETDAVQTEYEIEYETVTVQEGTLIALKSTNVRTGAGTGYERITAMRPGDTCEVIGEEDGWYHIIYNGVEGYITSEYLSVRSYETQIPLPTVTPAPTAMEGYELKEILIGTAAASNLNVNVRAGAGTKYDLVMQLAPLESCTIMTDAQNVPVEEEGWYQVQIGDVTGYVLKEFLELSIEYIQVPIAEAPTEVLIEETPAPEQTDEAMPSETPAPGYEWKEVEVGTVIAKKKVKMRTGAGTEYDEIRQLAPDTTFVVIGEEGDWYRIDLNGEIGYITKEYVETVREMQLVPIPTPTPEPTATPVPQETAAPGYEMREMQVGTVISDAAVSIREKADVNSAVLSYIASGRTCFVLDDEREWYKVEIDGYTGYVAKEYLSVEKKVTQVPSIQSTPRPTETAESGYEMVEKQVATVTANAKTNVRAGAGTEYDVVIRLSPGETCYIIGEAGDWYQVEKDGNTGYISKEFVSVSTQMVKVPIATPVPTAMPIPTETTRPSAAPGFEWVERVEGTLNAKMDTNVRQGAGTNYSVVTRMKPGETCTVLGEEGGWYRIEYNGVKGYISAEYITTRTYEELVEVIVEDPLDALLMNLSMPNVMNRGETHSLKGIIDSNIPLTGVTVTIEDLRNMEVEMSASAAISHDEERLQFDLMELDDKIKFRRLSAGEKRLTIRVNSANDEQMLLERMFYVIGSTNAMNSITDECRFSADSGRADRVKDERYSTAWQPEAAGDVLHISVPEQYSSETITLEWQSAPDAFDLILNGVEIAVSNEDERVHFTFATGGASDIDIRVSNQNDAVCELRVYAQEKTPEILQDWQTAGDKVDMMVIVAHQGDEFLLFGGAIPQAVAEGKEVLVVYMADCGRDRYAEAMSGLWAVGVRTHPVFLGLENGNPRAYEGAIDLWGLEETYEKLVEVLRRYRPDVVLTHDINGEDGDNQHKLTSAAVRRAVLLASDEGVYPSSTEQYGAWDTAKTYVHLYEANIITVDKAQVLDGLNGWTAEEAFRIGLHKNSSIDADRVKETYTAEDGTKYSMNSFGLIRTNVGYDEQKNSFFENIEPEDTEDVLNDETAF